MVLTREQIGDVKLIIKETISELLNDEIFIKKVAEKVLSNLNNNKQLPAYDDHIAALKQENKSLQYKISDLEQASRINNIRIIGLEGKNTKQDVLGLLKSIDVECGENDIKECYQLNFPRSSKPQVLVKFSDEIVKKSVLRKRALLKGKPIVITEDLVKDRYELLKKTRQRLGRTSVWVFNCVVKAKVKGKVHKIWNEEILDRIIINSTSGEVAA